ncbi:MAG TPA: peptidogalycan biosysnthesis protein, partial [Rhodocyclaceae bacterium]|nr:peptidogalycan biosysnthesis protein [Rhodocyclaceae bacterium]
MPRQEILQSIADIAEVDWQRLATEGDPFVSRAFLGAAEHCVTERGPLGWRAMHIALRDGEGIAGLLPLYERHHWYGDFAVDYGWDRAWQQSGLDYFPKLVTGVPFTPSPGPRLLTAGDDAVRAMLIEAVIDATVEAGASNWQCLF